ncbi:zf-HC2 domain-containing protein [Streptomyces sp. NPDC048581]|uniref:zf-HC2 domain-containing protein n=1 Tax=unclassified Streptomyces TaxID=2593676 RepID=UPI0037233F79
MTDWHASDTLVTHYANDSLTDPDAWSLEKHLESCAHCAARVSRAVRETSAGVVLAEVRESVLGAVLGAGERAAAEGTSDARGARTARYRYLTTPPTGSRAARVLWAAGPAVRGAWSAAVLGVALAAVLLARFADFAGARPLLLAFAPVVPVAGVALSYGAHADPLHEIAAATPSAGLRLVLTRTTAVLAVSLPLLTLAGLLLPSSGAPGAAAWLLPGLALTLVALALAGYVGFRAATALTGGGWLCAVLAPVLTADGRLTARLAEQTSVYLNGAQAQGGWAAAAVLCAALLAARRSAYDHLDRR